MAEANKEVIYIDIDDDITGIIDKVRGSKHKITALVLPKRAATLQSIVNMRLLKKKADEANKSLVLITSEVGLLPLAGAVGLHVAKTLQSKPVVPPPPDLALGQEAVVEETGEETQIDKSKSVGELAGGPTESSKESKPAQKAEIGEETIDIDNTQALDNSLPTDATSKKKGKNKVPNFNKFRKRLLIGLIGLIALIIGWFVAYVVLPEAVVTIKTSGISVDSEVTFTADTEAEKLDEKENIIPATSKSATHTDTEKVTATGEKNIGEKATGTVNLSASCSATVPTIPAGTTVSTGGVAFITQKSATLSTTSVVDGQCTFSGSTTVKAQNPGTNGNVSSGKAFIVSSYSSVSGSNSAAFSGGTDKNVTVVTQKDIDKAKSSIVANNEAAKADLVKDFEDENLFALEETITAGKTTITSSPKAGGEASEVTVTVETEYTMLGVKTEDLEKLVENDAKKEIDTSKQAITDFGLKDATFKVVAKVSDNEKKLMVQTTTFAGAQIDEAPLKEQVAGKKKGDIQQLVQNFPGVEEVNVSYSPFWVYKAPKSTSKITIVIEKVEQATDVDTKAQ